MYYEQRQCFIAILFNVLFFIAILFNVLLTETIMFNLAKMTSKSNNEESWSKYMVTEKRQKITRKLR